MTRLTSEQMREICNSLNLNVHAETIILFGSAAREQLREDSDVDIAFISNQQRDAYELFMIAQQLAEQLKREVDLIDFRQASTVLQAQIVGSGTILQDNNPVARQYTFMRSLKAYAMLNEEREQLIKDYQVTGGGQFDTGHHPEQNRNDSALHPEST